MHFESILGHRDVMERLGRLAFSGRMGQAYLFLGPRGVGRKLAAIGWAQVLNCLEPRTTFPYACGACRPCRKIASGQFPDLFIVGPEEGSKSLKIEQVRTVLREAHFKPFEGKKRIFVFDDADTMNDAAANALLKTLEEPSSTLVLILIAEHEGQLLSTIRSRCQVVRFGSLPTDIVRTALVNKGVSETDARWLANESLGSLGLAEEALAQQEERKELRNGLFTAIRSLRSDPIAAFKIAERYKKPEDAAPALRMLKTLYRDAVVEKLGEHDKVVNLDFADEIARMAAASDLEELVDGFDAIELAERRMEDFNANKTLVLERLLQELTPPPGRT